MLDAEYWQARYANDNFPWDIGYANTIHTDFVVKNIAKDARILIPGAGSGYEAEYLFDMGYINVFPLDYAPEAKE